MLKFDRYAKKIFGFFIEKKVDSITRLAFMFFLMGLLLLTYDGLPFISFADYKPVGAMLFICSMIFLAFTNIKKFKLNDVLLIIFIVYSIIHSLIVSMSIGNLSSNSINHILTLLLGAAVYFTTIIIIPKLSASEKNKKVINIVLLISLTLPISIGFLQLVDAYILKLNWVHSITAMFTSRSYNTRIQMLSNEPSWAVMHMITAFLFFWYIRKKFKLAYIYSILLVVLFLLSLSSYGILVVFIAFFLFVIIKRSTKSMVGLAACFLMYFLSAYLIEVLEIHNYFTHRFQLKNLDINHLLATDASFFVRIIFPLIGIYEFFKEPLFGVGGGYYYLQFPDILLKNFKFGLEHVEVYYNVYTNPENANPRNLLAKILSEEGLVGAVVFLTFLTQFLKKYCINDYTKLIFCLCIAMSMNFDSYAFFDFWLLLGFVRAGWFDTNKPVIKSEVL